MKQNSPQKMSTPDILKFSLGGFGVMATSILTMNYLTYFYTDIFGISSFVVAGLMLVSRIIDAITDPLMGIIADHTKTRFGKYRPYLLFASPIFGLIVFLLFTAPNLSATMKIIYVYVVYIGYSLASTAVNVPYNAMIPIVSKDGFQRTVIVTCKNVMTQTGKIVVTVFTIPLVNVFGGGAHGWTCYAALISVIFTICYWISAWGCKAYDNGDTIIHTERLNLKHELPLLFKNKPLLMLIIAYSTDMIANASLGAVNMYYFKYILHREDLVAIVGMAMTVTGLVGIPLIPSLTKKFGKKMTYWLTSLLSIFPLAVMWLNPTAPTNILVIVMGIFGLISCIPGALGWAMLPDCTDYAEWKYGIKGSGIVTSSFMFVNKLGSALGGAIASFFLGLVGFVANQEQSEAVIAMILFLRFGVPILGYIASIISIHFYELTDAKYDEIRADLDTRENNSKQ